MSDITGYRELSAPDTVAINNVKAAGEKIGLLVAQVRAMPDVDQRWAAIAVTNLQTGFMALVRSIARPTSFVIVLMVLLVGCSGGKIYQSQEMDSELNGDIYHYHNAVQLNLPASMFHATQSVNWMEMCKSRIVDPKTEQDFLYPFKDCIREDRFQLTTMGSVASQFITPVVTTAMYSGAFAYGLHQIGRGLGKSGTTVNQQGGGAKAENMTNSGNTSVRGNTSINSNNKNIMK